MAATSAGIVDGIPLLDLNYEEDARAEVDFNVVMTAKGEFVEVQGTAEAQPFPRTTLDSLLNLAQKGLKELFQIQRQALSSPQA